MLTYPWWAHFIDGSALNMAKHSSGGEVGIHIYSVFLNVSARLHGGGKRISHRYGDTLLCCSNCQFSSMFRSTSKGGENIRKGTIKSSKIAVPQKRSINCQKTASKKTNGSSLHPGATASLRQPLQSRRQHPFLCAGLQCVFTTKFKNKFYNLTPSFLIGRRPV